MTSRIGDPPAWLERIADDLHAYLTEAATQPEQIDSGTGTGWFTEPPGSGAAGRAPWTNLAGIEVYCLSEEIVLSFLWGQDRDLPGTRYLLPLANVTGTDELITRLDLFLDLPDWQARYSFPIGPSTRVVAVPFMGN
ncbi:hypothetical protein [Nocardia fluminea]|uniref:hypothetical protein n=1 Tax=Nocardia fluminea TaxID=134984 RepID=UPI0036608131